MKSIPIELLEQFEKNNVIPLVGDGVSHRDLPREKELVRELARRCNYPKDEPGTLRRVAGYYELVTRDRHGLVSFIRDQYDTADLEPTNCHRLIARLNPRVVVTINYDRLLEHAFKDESIPYTSVVANEEVAYGDGRKTLLVWLWGVVDRPDSLKITEDDVNQFLNDRRNLSDVLRGELSRHTWLFLGFDTEDRWFRHYYNSVNRGLDRHRRRSFVVEKSLSQYARVWWADKGEIIDVDVEPFLIELNELLASRRQTAGSERPSTPDATAKTVVPLLPERPYKFLDYYEAKDAPIFFGREAEIQKLCSLIHAHRLLLLYGASGSGKTSLLLAGVAPHLEGAQPGYEIIYTRVRENPLERIRSTVRRRLPEVDLPESGSLVDFFSAATRSLDRTLVIILDQFEEFFMRLNAASRQAFIAEMGELVDDPDVPIKLVLSLREDWLASVNEIRERIPEVFNVDLRLLPLTRQQARQAIIAPAEKLGISYDPELASLLLQDLTDGAKGEEDSAVNPPQLQLVCDALYDHAHANNRQLITLDDYQSVGGTQGVLDSYIEKALSKHGVEQRELAKNVLIALVTSHQTKARYDLETLATELGADEAEIVPVLDLLTEQRLLRRLDDGHSYELAHDILASAISAWFGEEERQRKQVRELLSREVADWHRDSNALLSHGKFRQINAMRDALRFTEEETAFLLRAAILYNMDVPYWLEQINDPAIEIDILEEMLENEIGLARLVSAEFLGNYEGDRAAIALAHTAIEDPEPRIRDMAAASLGMMQGQAGINFLQEVVAGRQNAGPDAQKSRALGALARIEDVSPGQAITVSTTDRLRILLALTKIRFQRDGPSIRLVTVAGAIGGAIGFGLGLLLPFSYQAGGMFNIQSISFLVFIMIIMALLGLFAGALMGFGISGAESLKRERAGMARIAGGTILGGLGFALVLSIFALVNGEGFTQSLLVMIGGGLFGALTGLGITIPAAFTSNRAAVLIGGALGASLGILAWKASGFKPLQVEALPIFALMASGGLTGLIMATGITMAYSRTKPGDRDETPAV